MKMGKKNKSSLGRSLINDRFSSMKNRRQNTETGLIHTTDLNDGYDSGKLNLKSVTEETPFEEFLSTAELAQAKFEAEKVNLKFVKPSSGVDTLNRSLKDVEKKHLELLKVPRRPPWNENTTPSELDASERESFLEWRRNIAILQDEEGFLLTPYEKNLEFWRQLWRVIERSDVVMQIVDARNPLLFRCEDLETYVKEVSENKENVLLINKADFLTEEQRKIWVNYFTEKNVKIIFYSATAPPADEEEDLAALTIEEGNSSHVYTNEELVRFFKTYHEKPKVTENKTTIGLVGYPNVGKSSTINSLLMCKKVAVSATPGKTKHFQTFNLDEDLILCDCPGLVMPSFVATKSDMIINGILPIDQMRDHVPPVTVVCSLIPRHIFEEKYGIIIRKPSEGEDPDRPPTSEELLNSFGFNRGFMTQNGQPDNARSSRYILKDFVNGKLLHCYAPPGVDQKTYHTFPERTKINVSVRTDYKYLEATRPSDVTVEDLDKVFFRKNQPGVHVKGVQKLLTSSNMTDEEAHALVENHSGAKPWKQFNKHKNKNKTKKVRKTYYE